MVEEVARSSGESSGRNADSKAQFGERRCVQPIGEGLSEMRIDYGPGYRVYYKQQSSVLVLLLCGGDKRTQQKDIAQARKIADEWKD